MSPHNIHMSHIKRTQQTEVLRVIAMFRNSLTYLQIVRDIFDYWITI